VLSNAKVSGASLYAVNCGMRNCCGPIFPHGYARYEARAHGAVVCESGADGSSSAKLSEANLTGAYLKGAILLDADLKKADLRGRI